MRPYRILVVGLVLVFAFFIALLIGVTGVQGLAYQADTLTPDPNLTPIPLSTLPPVEQTVSALETRVVDARIQHLETDLGNLKKPEVSEIANAILS